MKKFLLAAGLALWALGAHAQVTLSAITSLQAGTPPLAATPTFSPSAGSYTSTQTVTISDSTPSPTIYYTTNGSTPTTASSVYSSALTVSSSQQVQAIATASGYAQSLVGSATYTITTSATLYPQVGIQAIYGNQYFPTANLQQIATYPYVLIGGNYTSWPAANGLHSGYSTRDQVVQAIKSYTGSGGKNAVLPQVYQYENAGDLNASAAWWVDWYNAVNCNNWWLYNSHASGTKTQSVYNASWYVANPALVVGIDSGSCDNTGLYPWQLMAKLLYKRYYLGTGDAGSAMASTHLNGYYIDNQTARNLAGTAADWERNGTNPSQTDPTATGQVSTGKAQYCSELATLNSSIACTANSEFGYDFTASSCGALGMSSSNNRGIYVQGMQQFTAGSSDAKSNVMTWGGLSCFMTWYENLESGLAAGGVPVLTGSFDTTDYVQARYFLGAVLLRNGVAVYGLNISAAGNQDVVDPANTATYPQFDEFWGGAMALAGYMGATVTGARGAEQTASWSNGVWERNLQNCAVFVNPAGNGSQTVTVTGLGYTNLYHLDGTQDHTHNPGGATPVTSLTIASPDSTILCNTVSP